jgi:site-specific recombinase XerD
MKRARKDSGTTVAVVAEPRPPELRDTHREAVVSAAIESHAPKTRRSYRTAWRHFTEWCAQHGYEPLPGAPETVAAYLTDRAAEGASVATLKLARAAIRYEHEERGIASPTHAPGVVRVLRGLRRRAAGSKPALGQAKGLTVSDLAAIRATAHLPRCGPTGRTESPDRAAQRGRVDVALIATMRDGLLRRSEACALTWADVEFRDDGTGRITIRVSKTDQAGVGAVQFLGADAAADLQAIRGEAEDDDRVFPMSTRTVANRIQAAARAAGLKSRYSGHSPRVGMAQDLVEAGFGLAAIQVAGRWASARMPAHYSRGQAAAQGAVARYYRA